MAPIIRTENLTHIYSQDTPFEKLAIQGVDFQAEKAEFIGIIGHTGSGKSTFIQHLNGLIKPTEGRVLFNGQDIHASKETIRDIRFKVGLVFQYPEYQLFEETVYKDISFGPRNMKLDAEEIDFRVRDAIRLVGIGEELLEKSPFELSGGQKRRVAIAGVIAMEPEVLVLDEPTAGLDPRGREDLLSNIRAYHKERGTTVVLVSHSMEEIARNVDRIVVLADSHVLLSGTPHEVFSHGETLTQAGLDVPEVTRIAMSLRQRGLPVDAGVYTVQELSDALLALRKGGAVC